MIYRAICLTGLIYCVPVKEESDLSYEIQLLKKHSLTKRSPLFSDKTIVIEYSNVCIILKMHMPSSGDITIYIGAHVHVKMAWWRNVRISDSRWRGCEFISLRKKPHASFSHFIAFGPLSPVV